jgi:outer membrane protein assembly factor BamE (lipoprotein component of BamABCDE complex)
MISKRNNTRIVIVLVVVSVLTASIYGYYRWQHREGYRNKSACDEIKPGARLSDLINAMGNPMHHETVKGHHWYYFETSSIAPGPISARVEDSTGNVLELRCSEDGPSTWVLSR